MLKLVIFIPKTHSDQLKERLWEAGLGKQGEYENCAFTSDGIGSFKPLEGANPTIGNNFNFEKVEEHRVEMLCEEKLKEIAILCSGECFGDYELINNHKRAYDIVCDSEFGEVFELQTEDYYNFF